MTSANDSKPLKSVTAVCPAGRQVVGAEFSISGGAGSIVLDDLVPSSTSVRVDAREDANGTSANWLVRAIARCANPLPGYEIVSANSGSTSDSKSVSATCTPGRQLDLDAVAICANPLPGRQVLSATSASTSAGKLQEVACPDGTDVLSAGFDIFGGVGDVTVTGLSTYQFGDTASAAALEDDNGTAASWSVRALVVCVVP